MSLWRQAMLYLGLGPDEEYDEGGARRGELVGAEPATRPAPTSDRDDAVVRVVPVPMGDGPTDPAPSAPHADEPPNGTRRSAMSEAGIEPTGSVRTIPVSPAKPHIVVPRSFNDAQQVADRFKSGQAVLVNLQDVGRDLSRRLIDFTSGLCYGLDGNLEKVADAVYLLAPANVSLPDDERQRLQERGLHY